MRLKQASQFLAGLVLLTAVILLMQADVAAQCSMCRASLSGSNNAFFIRNFNLGVLVLLIPPVAMFCSFFVVLRRHKLRDDQAGSAGLPEEPKDRS